MQAESVSERITKWLFDTIVMEVTRPVDTAMLATFFRLWSGPQKHKLMMLASSSWAYTTPIPCQAYIAQIQVDFRLAYTTPIPCEAPAPRSNKSNVFLRFMVLTVPFREFSAEHTSRWIICKLVFTCIMLWVSMFMSLSCMLHYSCSRSNIIVRAWYLLFSLGIIHGIHTHQVIGLISMLP